MTPYTFHSLINLLFIIIIMIYKFIIYYSFIIIIHLQILLIIYNVLLSFFVIIHFIIVFQFTLVSYTWYIRIIFHFYINTSDIFQISIVAGGVFFHLNSFHFISHHSKLLSKLFYFFNFIFLVFFIIVYKTLLVNFIFFPFVYSSHIFM
jgi:hypothetical protein